MATSLDQTNQCSLSAPFVRPLIYLRVKTQGWEGWGCIPYEPNLKVHRDPKDPFASMEASPKGTGQDLPRWGRLVGQLRQPHSWPGTAFL